MKEPTRAPFFACLYPGLCDTARSLGYALAIHGTVTSDLDLIAVPWTEEAVREEDLVQALIDHIGALDYEGLLRRDLSGCPNEAVEKRIQAEAAVSGPGWCQSKPHGRRAWNLYMDFGAKVDLSVMPRLPSSC